MTVLDLFTAPPAVPERPREPEWMRVPADRIARRFVDFHRANPHVYAELEGLVLRAFHAGVEHLSVRDLWGAMRYTVAVERRPADAWKLDNSHTALYARLLVWRWPEVAGMIETRERLTRAAAAVRVA